MGRGKKKSYGLCDISTAIVVGGNHNIKPSYCNWHAF